MVSSLELRYGRPPQERAAQMWAVHQLRAGEFMLGIKAKAHGRSSLNDQNLADFLGLG